MYRIRCAELFKLGTNVFQYNIYRYLNERVSDIN